MTYSSLFALFSPPSSPNILFSLLFLPFNPALSQFLSHFLFPIPFPSLLFTPSYNCRFEFSDLLPKKIGEEYPP